MSSLVRQFALLAAALVAAKGPVCAQKEVIGQAKSEAERRQVLADKPTAAIPETAGTGVTEKLGQKIDLNLTFAAEDGSVRPLKDYFASGRPVILNLVYYTCPMLCNLTLNAQVAVLRELAWTPGKEFEVVTISIDPTESPRSPAIRRKRTSATSINPSAAVGISWSTTTRT